jgi:uncharacterized protein YlxW (UPF0749 family)
MGAAIALGGLSIGQSILGASAANSASKQQAAIQEQQYKINRESSITARNLKTAQSTLELRRSVEQIAGEKMDAALQALETSESNKVSAAEAGVSGQTVDLLVQDPRTALYRQNTKYSDQINDMQTNQLLQARGLDAEAINRINAVDRGVSVTKSFWSEFIPAAISSAESTMSGGSNLFTGTKSSTK